ncbi:MAG TPA: hypothetical protein VMW80_06850 [Candidatus Dormibacteraeota bacterium]|nr:hypothetical protein [Candidatus Dormibacteraeota bacterium]
MGAIWAAIWAAVIAAVVAIILAWRGHQDDVRDRRRATYSDAYKAAMGWVEMVYRVRRRSNKEDPTLVELFHARQEAITYFQGWISTESEAMGTAYGTFVAKLRAATEDLLREAWAQDPKPPWVKGHGEGPHPECQAASNEFLRLVRMHLSPWPWVTRGHGGDGATQGGNS